MPPLLLGSVPMLLPREGRVPPPLFVFSTLPLLRGLRVLLSTFSTPLLPRGLREGVPVVLSSVVVLPREGNVPLLLRVGLPVLFLPLPRVSCTPTLLLLLAPLVRGRLSCLPLFLPQPPLLS